MFFGKATAIEMNKMKDSKITFMSIGMTALKYWDKAKLFCKDTGSFIVHVKSKDVYPDLTGDVEKRFDISISKL